MSMRGGGFGDIASRQIRLIGRSDVFFLNSIGTPGNAWGSADNPAAVTTLVTTGDLVAGRYLIGYEFSSSDVNLAKRIEHLDAANAVLKAYPVGDGPGGRSSGWFLIDLAVNEEVRIQLTGAQAGRYSGRLNWIQLIGP